ncbi:uncharacterized protein Z519_02159 [Cladophialophora bantiana CBS 173.52]|uniref:Fe2OG dioxygenase domain-containing protein n=1 Tax=Cladophialophora bantiana (strain ATCC 10958 / CBS 173.52 / CDC B-1940 / NIH 8579) TaxID=1442370 RepID=A0A0D2HTJ0_CLAB1|nr:uncharacterized protein Z519_02159 [Cladophialophora bantiana CBS 173.52]KIW96768.1 hypothetical protein Z519_02159 [Cladophialophora bantiana CBS 173.52]
MIEPANIPLFSFAPFLHGKPDTQKALAQDIFKAFSDVGFVYLKDYGIPAEEVEAMFDLTKRFFQLPMDLKKSWKIDSANANQGYSPEGAEAGDGVDHKESYEHRRKQNDKCPTEEQMPGFKKAMDEFYGKCLTLCEQILCCLAMAIGLPGDFFQAMSENADPQLRILHYPSIQRSIIEQDKHARIIPHTDFGFCTLLFQDSIGGLEVDSQHDGVFHPAAPIPGTVLINIADLLQRLSNDRLRSTIHRVVAPQASGDVLPARYSIPFFYHPSPEATIDPIVMGEGEVKKYEPVNAGHYRYLSKLSTYPELRVFAEKAPEVGV